MASVPLFMRPIALMTPSHLAPNNGVDINPKMYLIFIELFKNIYGQETR
jgi:hypothetical protein